MITQECEKLLENGWELCQHKDVFNRHSYYLRDSNRDKNRNFRVHYINRVISENLQKKGYVMLTHVVSDKTTEGNEMKGEIK